MRRWVNTAEVVVFFLGGLLCGCSWTEDPVKIYNRGVTYYNQGDYSSAMGMFKWSLEKRREYSAPMIGLARCHLALARDELARKENIGAFKDLENALYWTNQAIAIDPGNTEPYTTKIDILKVRGQVEQAIATARRATEQAGPSANTLIMLARTYGSLGDYDNAELALKQGLRISPQNVELTVELARLYDKLGRTDLALHYYEQAYRLDRHYPNLLMRIAQLRVRSARSRQSQQRLSETAPPDGVK